MAVGCWVDCFLACGALSKQNVWPWIHCGLWQCHWLTESCHCNCCSKECCGHKVVGSPKCNFCNIFGPKIVANGIFKMCVHWSTLTNWFNGNLFCQCENTKMENETHHKLMTEAVFLCFGWLNNTWSNVKSIDICKPGTWLKHKNGVLESNILSRRLQMGQTGRLWDVQSCSECITLWPMQTWKARKNKKQWNESLWWDCMCQALQRWKWMLFAMPCVQKIRLWLWQQGDWIDRLCGCNFWNMQIIFAPRSTMNLDRHWHFCCSHFQHHWRLFCKFGTHEMKVKRSSTVWEQTQSQFQIMLHRLNMSCPKPSAQDKWESETNAIQAKWRKVKISNVIWEWARRKRWH